MADAVFQEVLEIQVDTSSFVEGLSALESAYDDFVERVNAKGFGAGNVINVATFAEIQNQLQGLQGYLQEFDASVTASMEGLDTKLNQVAADAAKAGQAVVDAKAAAAQSGGSDEESAGGGALGGTNNIVQSLAGGNAGILSMLASTAQFLLLWRVVGTVIDGVMKVLSSPIEFVKSGLNYLKNLQDSAAELQGILASNVEYSKKTGENFAFAGESAVQVIKKLQDIAIATGLPVENLQRTFEAVIQSGAAHYVTTMGQAVTLAEDFSILMKAAGSGMEGQRRILQDIPQLLEGNVSSSSRILEVLGITKDKWAEIRAEALQHGNLVQLLTPYVLNYMAVVGDANKRQDALTKSIELLGQRIAAAVAVPLWQEWIKLLQDAKAYLETHADLIEKVGASCVTLVSRFTVFVGEITKAITGFKSLDEAADGILNKIETTVKNMTLLTDLLERSQKEHGNSPTVYDKDVENVSKSLFGGKRQLSKADQDLLDKTVGPYGTMEDALDAVIKKSADAASAVAAVQTGTQKVGNDVSLDTKISPNKDLVDLSASKKKQNDAFRILQNEYRDQLAETKDAFLNAEKDIKSAQEEGTISAQKASQQRIAAIAENLASIKQLVAQYTALANKSGADPKAVKEFTENLSKVGNIATADAASGITSTNAAENKTEEETTQKHLEALRALEVQHAATMLAIYKQEAAEGLHTKVEVFDQEVALRTKEHTAIIADLNAELAAVGEDEAKKSVINARIASEDQKYTDQHKNDAQTRTDISYKEAQQRTADGDKIRASILQLSAANNADADIHGRSVAQQIDGNRKLAQAYVNLRQEQVNSAQAALAHGIATHQDADAIGALEQKLVDAQTALQNALNVKDKADENRVTEKIFGADNLSDAFSGFSQDVTSLGNAFKFFAETASKMVNAFKSGEQSGGTLGGIGGVASEIGGMIPGPVGAIVSGVGSLFSFIGNLFTAAAQKVAKDVQTATSQLMEQYSNGTATLAQTITALENERNTAIQQLSGMKDGQQQLDKILPGLNSQISQLLQQQKQTTTQFENQAEALHLQSTTLGSVLTQWQQINKQVQDYIGAGGSVATAQQYLSDSLAALSKSTISQLQQADQQAISDAQNLNQLLIQRVQLAKQYAQQEFALKNGDSIERASNTALNAAITYQQQKAQNDQNLQNIDSQISLMTTRVSMESQVFSLAQSTADLQKQSNSLNIEQLATQIQQYKDMQTIVNSIYKNPDGSYAASNESIFPTQKNANLTGPISLVGNGQLTGGSIDSMFNNFLQKYNDGKADVQSAINVLTAVMNGRKGENDPATGALAQQMATVISILEARQVGPLPNTTVQDGAYTLGSTGAGSNPSGVGSTSLTVQQLAAQIAAELGSSVTDPNGLATQIAQQLLNATGGTIVPLAPVPPVSGAPSQLYGAPGAPVTSLPQGFDAISNLLKGATTPTSGASGVQIGTLQVVITDSSGADPSTLANGIYSELQKIGRYGADTSY